MKRIIIISFLFTMYGCHEYPTDIKGILKSSGKNKEELSKVIEYYKKANEPQKLEAVYFLYRNMTTKFHLEGAYYDSLNVFYECLNNSTEYKKERGNDHGYLILNQLADSVYALSSSLINQISIVYDLKSATSRYLIENIDLAFDTWRNMKWEESVSFDSFLEFILPYKISTESPINWRESILLKYPDLLKEIKEINNIDTAFSFLSDRPEANMHTMLPFELNKKMLFDRNFNHYDIVRMGDCSDETIYSMYFMKTFAIPCAHDYLIAWGNTNLRHDWVKLIKPDKQRIDSSFITNVNNRENTQEILSSSFSYCSLNPSLENIEIQYKRTVPKVYRETFSYQKDRITLNEEFPNEIHPNFQDYSQTDVSDEYLDCGSVTINLQKKDTDINVVYLCVFSRNGWIPVDIERVRDGAVTFSKIGKNVIFLPMSYRNNDLSPIDKPFYVTTENRKNVFSIRNNKLQTVILKRKHPLFGGIVEYANTMIQARFIVSKSLSFIDTISIHNVESTSIIPSYFDVNIPNGYTYLKFTPPDGYRVVFAELEFFYKDKGILTKLSRDEFQLIGNSYTSEVEKLFDNEFGSIYNSPPIIFKFLNPEKEIIKMRYCPRSDTDFVEPGDTYELFYWNESWISLGTKIAEDFSISYSKVPENAILWLKNLTKGKEERIFTYENGKQVWW